MTVFYNLTGRLLNLICIWFEWVLCIKINKKTLIREINTSIDHKSENVITHVKF